MNSDVHIIQKKLLKHINSFSVWISNLSWGKFILFIFLVGIASDNLQELFTNNTDHNWLAALTALFIVFCVGIKFLITGKVKAEEKAQKEMLARQLSDSRFKAMQSQIDPHFFFNTLATLQYLIDSDYKKAQDLLKQTTIYLRYVLPENDKKLVTLEEELTVSKAYLEIIKYRFSDKFDFSINIKNNPSLKSFPYTIIQNILDSAIHFGIEPNTEMSFISITYENNLLTIENSVYSSDYANQEVNDLYLKNVISILESLEYSIMFDNSNPKILKLKITLK